ncbi:Ivy family c-type lysozyme inhibitor [Pseudomonas chlororaphis]|uniref:Ivy family c-type lysozyme inhibitor n=1 Tax=Pseudomonas chlororaphis TaxID=587753 RepID=UPI000BE2BF22|nr:Ivy family c-type lysozyme inhibitor [Pseudomonas chlororaphis]
MRKSHFVLLAALPLSLMASAASAEQYLFEIADKAPYKQAYAEMLAFPSWVSEAKGTATPIENVSVDGKSFTMGKMCKPHDCLDNQLFVVFSADGKKSWGLLVTRAEDGKAFNKQFLGNPDNVVTTLLNKSFAKGNPED